MDKTDKLSQSKGNIEIEGIQVPETEIIEFLVKKYQDKLGEEAVNSLFYSLYQGKKIYEEEQNGKHANKRSSK